MIAVGAKLIAEFHWILYVFGVLLIVTAVKMLLMNVEHGDPNQNLVVRLTRRLLPVTARFHGEHFLVRAGSAASRESEVPGAVAVADPVVEGARPGTLLLTPLALALIVVETTDLIFAVDSIPAIFAITADPFLVFTSNVFAILGLRSLFFALAGMLGMFRYLKPALALVLAVVGVKMLTASWLKELLGANFNFYVLGFVLGILAIGVAGSVLAGRREDWEQGVEISSPSGNPWTRHRATQRDAGPVCPRGTDAQRGSNFSVIVSMFTSLTASFPAAMLDAMAGLARNSRIR